MSRYFLYYAGFDESTGIEQIGLAISEDLVNWSRPVPGPIVPLRSTGEADSVQTSNPCVLKRANGYRMWYQGRNRTGQISICHATSTDGLRWSFGDAPVLAVPPEVRGNRVGYHHPHVLFDEERGIYRMWCTRYQDDVSHFLYAESNDGLSWQTVSEDVMHAAAPWEGKLLFYPCIMRESHGFTAWYSGLRSKKAWRIGRAISTDGLNWHKDPEEAILPLALPPAPLRFVHEQLARIGIYSRKGLAAFGTASPNVWRDGDVYHMLTHDVGARGKLSIGHYVSVGGVAWRQIGWDILSRGHGKWDAFFQADPFLIRI
jgi:predicted GH43/DUF377 family glycosyl hydrolase